MVEDGGHSDRNGNRDPIETLSQRQLGVLELLAKGLTNEEVAGVLGISPTTVRTHVTAVLARLEVSNRTEAAAAYLDLERALEAASRPCCSVRRSPCCRWSPWTSDPRSPCSRLVRSHRTSRACSLAGAGSR
jgi:DNA-binding CsgD family transcriptional regulator